MKRLALVALLPALAAAEPITPEAWYVEGNAQYNLGNFDAAIEAFKKAFAAERDVSKKAAHLYNIAQAYRQAKDCDKAQFFYKRFLSLKEQDTERPLSEQVRREVEEYIVELNACVRYQEEIKSRPPDGPRPPETLVAPERVSRSDEEPQEPEVEPEEQGEIAVESHPQRVSVRLSGGGTKISIGELGVPLQAAATVTGAYVLPVRPDTVLELGGAVGYTRVSWETMTATRTTPLATIGANAAVVHELRPRVSVRGELGIGTLLIGNPDESPFTHGARTEGGALALLHVRAGVAVDYALTRNIVATLPLSLAVSPARSGVAGTITAFEFMIGLGYRL